MRKRGRLPGIIIGVAVGVMLAAPGMAEEPAKAPAANSKLKQRQDFKNRRAQAKKAYRFKQPELQYRKIKDTVSRARLEAEADGMVYVSMPYKQKQEPFMIGRGFRKVLEKPALEDMVLFDGRAYTLLLLSPELAKPGSISFRRLMGKSVKLTIKQSTKHAKYVVSVKSD